MYIATLISDKEFDLSNDLLHAIQINKPVTVIKKQNFYFANLAIENKSLLLKQFCSDNKIDILVQNKNYEKKQLLICDMESTIIENEFLDEIADLLNIKPQVAVITERAMNGEIDFESALKERVKLIKGLPEEQVSELLISRLKYNPGAKQLLKSCKQAGIYTMLVSGGFTIFTDYVAKELGFDESHANQLIFEQGKVSHVKEPILGKQSKLQLLEEKAKALKISLNETVAIGDGANDLPMLHAAGLGIAYKAKPKVRAEIENQINYTDLSAVIYALGLTQ